MNIASKIKRRFACLIYDYFAKHLPISYHRGGDLQKPCEHGVQQTY